MSTSFDEPQHDEHDHLIRHTHSERGDDGWWAREHGTERLVFVPDRPTGDE